MDVAVLSVDRVVRVISVIIVIVLMQGSANTATTTPDSGSNATTTTTTTTTDQTAQLQASLEAMESRVDSLESRLQTSQEQLNETQLKLKDMGQRLDMMEQNVSSLSCPCAELCCQGNNTQYEDAPETTASPSTSATKHLHCGKIQPRVTGVQQIWVNSQFRNVYCDGEWTVIQRRQSGLLDFYRGWNDYEKGFGDAEGEYWLGLEAMHTLTSNGTWMLTVELDNWQNVTGYALYRGFKLLPATKQYILQLGKFVRGTAGDSLFVTHKRMKFSTKDKDNDKSDNDHCAQSFHGAWWYNSCLISNLNGKYYNTSTSGNDGILWKSWMGYNYSLKTTLMKIKLV